MIVVRRTYGGAYILAELDGTISLTRFAAFWVIPYFPRTNIPIPDLDDSIIADIPEDDVEHNVMIPGDDAVADGDPWVPKRSLTTWGSSCVSSFMFSLDFPIFPMPRDLHLEVVDVNGPRGGRFGGTPYLFLFSFLIFSNIMSLSLALVSVKQS